MDKFCEDCIHNGVCRYEAYCPSGHCNDKDTLDDIIPQGEWIKEYKDFKCSLCGKIAYSWNDHGTYIQIKSDFCPHCGAKMRGGVE